MGTIKLDKDEMLKIAGKLSALKEEINYILNKTFGNRKCFEKREKC